MFIPDRARFFVIHRVKGSQRTVIDFYKDDFLAKLQFDSDQGQKEVWKKWGSVSQLHNVLTNPDNQHLREAVQAITDNKHKLPQGNKYSREVKPGVWVDVYDAVGAFMAVITDPLFLRIRTAVDHAAKKLLAPGNRGHKELKQDLEEARDSIDRALQQLDEWA